MERNPQNPVHALKAHLALNVRNVVKSTDFYQKMLGIEPSKVRTGYAKFDLQNPPLNLTLNEVAFHENHRREIVVGVHFELDVIPAREAVVAAVRAAAIRVQAPSKLQIGTLVPTENVTGRIFKHLQLYMGSRLQKISVL